MIARPLVLTWMCALASVPGVPASAETLATGTEEVPVAQIGEIAGESVDHTVIRSPNGASRPAIPWSPLVEGDRVSLAACRA
jgi:hypothetical protein